MAWPIVNFGKWTDKGKSLPQVLLDDPDWFFWAYDAGALRKYARAAELYEKARAIKIPQTKPGTTLVAEYFIHPPTGKFGGVHIVPSDQPQHEGSSSTWRQPVLDLAAARGVASYDKTGCAILARHLRAMVWPEKKRLPRATVEAFFDDDQNFDI
jgi:hypothetical protein